MDSSANSRADRAELRATSRRPRFQYSLRSLLWFVTGCAAVSAVLGMIGPEWRLAAIAGIPHFTIWGIPITLFALRAVRLQPVTAVGVRAVISVGWAMLIYFVAWTGLMFGAGVIDLLDTSDATKSFTAKLAIIGIGEMLLAMWLQMVALMTWVAVAVVAFIAKRKFFPYASRPRLIASILGAAAGAFVALCAHALGANPPVAAERTIVQFGYALPIAIGCVLPPLLITWADRLERRCQMDVVSYYPPRTPRSVRAAIRAVLGRSD